MTKPSGRTMNRTMNRVTSRRSTFQPLPMTPYRGPLKKFVFLLPVCFVFGIVEASHPPDNMEWQYWNEFVVVHELAPRWQRESAIAEPGGRFLEPG